MANARDYMDYLDDEITIAPATSQEEFQAAETIMGIMKDHGLEPIVQEFDAHPGAKMAKNLLMIVVFVGAILSGITTGAVSIVGFVLVLAGTVLLVLSGTERNPLERIGGSARSQNVVAVHRATGDKVVKGARPIVIVAHYDTPRESPLYGKTLGRYQRFLNRAVTPCSVVVLVLTLLQLVTVIPSIIRMTLWVVCLIATIPMDVLAVAGISERFSPCTGGANDNKASVAAMLSVMNTVRPSEDRVDAAVAGRPYVDRDSDGEPGVAVVEEEVFGVRHGAEVLRELGVLPPECEIIYEDPKVQYIDAEGQHVDIPESNDILEEDAAWVDSEEDYALEGDASDEAPTEDESLPEYYDEDSNLDEDITSESNGGSYDSDLLDELGIDDDFLDDQESAAERDVTEIPEGSSDYEEDLGDYARENGEPKHRGFIDRIKAFFADRREGVASIRRGRNRDDEVDFSEYESEEVGDSEDWGDEDQYLEELKTVTSDDIPMQSSEADNYLEEDYLVDEAEPDGAFREVEDDAPVSDDSEETDQFGFDADEMVSVPQEQAYAESMEDVAAIDAADEEFDAEFGSFDEPGEVDEDGYSDIDAGEQQGEIASDDEVLVDEESSSGLRESEINLAEASVDVEGSSAVIAAATLSWDDEAELYTPAAASSQPEVVHDEGVEATEDAQSFDDEGAVFDEAEDPADSDAEWGDEDTEAEFFGDEDVFEELVADIDDPDQPSSEAAFDDADLGETGSLEDDQPTRVNEVERDSIGNRVIGAFSKLREAFGGDSDSPEDGPEANFVEDAPNDVASSVAGKALPSRQILDDTDERDILPKDTRGLDTISDSYDWFEEGEDSLGRPDPIDDPTWGQSFYEPAVPSSNIARRAVLFDLPDPSGSSNDPFDDDIDDVQPHGVPNTSSDDVEDLDDLEEMDDIDPRRDNWMGGAAVRSDLRANVDSDESIEDNRDSDIDAEESPDEEELQDAILGLGDEYLIAHDIWFVATGASECGNAGVKAFLQNFRSDIRGAYVVNLDCVGAGMPTILTREGERNSRKADRRLVHLVESTAEDLGLMLQEGELDWKDSDATPAMRARLRSISIVGRDEDGLQALSHTVDDVPMNVMPAQVGDIARLICEVIRRA